MSVQGTKFELCNFVDLAYKLYWHLKLVLNDIKMKSKIHSDNLNF